MKPFLILVLLVISGAASAGVYDCEVNVLDKDPETGIVEPTTVGNMTIDPDKDDTQVVDIEKGKIAATCTVVPMGCCGTGRALVCGVQGYPLAQRPDLLHNMTVVSTEAKFVQHTATPDVTGGGKAYSIACLFKSFSASRAERHPAGD